MLDHHNSKSEIGIRSHSVSLVSEWVDIQHSDIHQSEIQQSDTVVDAGVITATSTDDLLAIYNCFDVLERVWPTEPDLQQTAGPFTLEKEIGRGGMGRVWSAIQHEPVKRNVAVKLINPGPQTQQMVRRFESERNVLALMNHPAIATLIDAGQTDDGQLYFAMEMVEGPDLISYCNRNKFSTEQRLNLFLDACSAVQHAHQKGIIHRDLKPSNILVGEIDDHPRLKVIDFGLSKLHEAPLEITNRASSEQFVAQRMEGTQDGQIIGSLRYMSPEQAAADVASIDVRSDVYSLGIVLFKLLTDSAPLDAKRLDDAPVQRLLESIQFEEDSPPSKFLAGLPSADSEKIVARRQISIKGYQRILKSDLDWIAMRAIAKNPDSRYQTVTDFANDIQRFLNHEPVLARPESLHYKVKKELAKNRVLWASVTGVIIALLAGILVSGYGLVSANNARNLAEKRLDQSRKSNRILSDIFNGMDLMAVQTQTEPFKVLVGRKLVQAANEIDIDAVGDPLDALDLKIKLAEALNGLEFYEEAIPICREAWNSVQVLDNSQNADLTYLAGIALTKALIGDATAKEAVDIIDPLYAQCCAEQGEDSETALELLLLRGRVAYSTHDDDEALHCFTEVANRREARWGKSDLRTLDAKFWLTEVYVEPGVAEAELPLAEEVLRQYRKLLPEGHPRTIKAILNTAWIRSIDQEYNFKETGQLANEGLELAKKTYGENHPTTYHAKLIVGLLTHRNGKHEDSVRLLEEAWAGLSETTRSSHPRTIMAIRVLASVNEQTGNLKRAVALLEEALSLTPPGSGIELWLGKLHYEIGNFKAARALLTATIEDVKGLQHEDETVSNCLHGIARCLNCEDRSSEAIKLMKRAIKLAPSEERYHFWGMRKVLVLARSYSLNGDYDKAIQTVDDYLRLMPDSMGPKNRVRLCAQAERGLIFREYGKIDQAIDELLPVVRSGVILLHHDYLVHELRLSQMEVGQPEAVLAGVDRELKFIRSTFPNDSVQGAIRLKGLGYDLIELGLIEKAKEVLAESVIILEKASPGSWMLAKSQFDIAVLDFDDPPPESDASFMAEVELELENKWSELMALKDETFSGNINKLASSVRNIINVYKEESNRKAVALWRSRLKTLRK